VNRAKSGSLPPPLVVYLRRGQLCPPMASCLSACVGGPGPQPGVNARRAGGKDTASPPPPPFSTRHQIANGYLDLDSSSRHRRSVVSCSAAAAAGEQGGDRIAGRRGAPGGRKAGRQPTNQRRARGVRPWQPSLLVRVTSSTRRRLGYLSPDDMWGRRSDDPTHQASRVCLTRAGASGAVPRGF